MDEELIEEPIDTADPVIGSPFDEDLPDEEVDYAPLPEDESAEGEEPVDFNPDTDPDETDFSQEETPEDEEYEVEGEDADDGGDVDMRPPSLDPDNSTPNDPLFYGEPGDYLTLEISDEEAALDPDADDLYSPSTLVPDDDEWALIPDEDAPPVAPFAMMAMAEESDDPADMTADDFATENVVEAEASDVDRDIPEFYEVAGRAPGGEWQTLAMVSATEVDAELAGLPSGEDWLFRVRAVFASGEFGEWSAETEVQLPVDMIPPPAPSTPTVVGSRGVVTLTWDGLGVGGVKQPADYKHTVVWQSATGVAGTWNNLGLMMGADDFHVTGLPYNQTTYFSLSSRDLMGNESARSGNASVSLKPLVEEPDIAAELDRMEQETADREQVIRDSVDGKTSITDSTIDAAIGTPGLVVGDRWQKWNTLGNGGKLLASWRWDGAAWIVESMDAVYLPKIDIGQGTFSNLNGDRLEVGSVHAGKMAIGDFTNLIPNAGFNFGEDATGTWNGLAGWTGSNSTRSVITLADGTLALKLVTTSAAEESHAYSEKFDVTPGERLRISYDTTGTSVTTGNAAIWAYGYDAAGVQSDFNMGTGGASTPGKLAYEFVVPLKVVRMLVRPYTSKANGVGTFGVFSNIKLRRMENGELIVDGAIKTDKLDAKSVTAGKIATNAITADAVDAGAITAKHTITGAKIQTTATALRGVEITSAGLKAYDGSGNVKVAINSNGTAEFTGNVTGSTVTGGTVTGASILGGSVKMASDDGYTVELGSGYDSAYARFHTPTSAISGNFGGTVRAEDMDYFGEPWVTTTVHSPTGGRFTKRTSFRLSAGAPGNLDITAHGSARLTAPLILGEASGAPGDVSAASGQTLSLSSGVSVTVSSPVVRIANLKQPYRNFIHAAAESVATHTYTRMTQFIAGAGDHGSGGFGGIAYSGGVATVSQSGIYHLEGLLCFDASNAGTRSYLAFLVGGQRYRTLHVRTVASGTIVMNQSLDVYIAAGATVEMLAYQASGSTVNIPADWDLTRWSIRKVGI